MRLTTFFFIGLVSLAVSSAQSQPFNTNRVVRSLTLEECIREALEHNLRIQIRRFDPNANRFTLAAAYGVYDPLFEARYTRFYNSTEGRFNPNTGVTSSSSTADADTFSPRLSGSLPYTGLQYDLGGSFTHSRGSRGLNNTFDDYISTVDIQLTQPLLKNFWIDSARLVIEQSKLDVKISELALEDEVRVVVHDVELAYYELMFAQDNVKVKEKALELANALVAQNREKVRVGTLAPLDQRQAESRGATAEADLIDAQRQLGTAQTTLVNLLTDNFEAWLGTALLPSDKLVAVPEPLNLLDSWRAAVSKRPDYRELLLQAEKQGILVKFRKNQIFPELNLIGGYGLNGLDSSYNAVTNGSGTVISPGYSSRLGGALDDISSRNNPFWSAGAVLRVPLSNKTERNRLKAAKEVAKQFDFQIKKLQQDMQVDVDIAMGSAIGSYQRVSATRQARLFAEEALAAEQTKYENGKSTPFQVLQFQSDLSKALSDEIRALADYNESLTTLFYRDGTLLERRKISIKK